MGRKNFKAEEIIQHLRTVELEEGKGQRLVGWLVAKARKNLSAQEIKEIRNVYTDERKILEMILAGSAKANDLPEVLRKALREVSGLPLKTRINSLKTNVGDKA